jgi:hypothetical protein
LLVGIEVHENVTFVELLEPPTDQTSERECLERAFDDTFFFVRSYSSLGPF